MARCFVISPIGADGSEVREHADDVWKFIIQPALKNLGIEGYRSDHAVESGKITQQIYDSILKEDFCIAVLTYHNPNVFYEIAIAQSAGKPVIFLIEKGTEIPFDLHNERSLFYDLRPSPLFDGTYSANLEAMIQSVERSGWKAAVPFGTNLSPLGAAPTEAKQADWEIFHPAEQHFRTEFWVNLVEQSQSVFHMSGYGFTGWPIMPGASEALARCKERGCDIRVMTYDGSNPAFREVSNIDRISAANVESLAASFEKARAFFRQALGSQTDVRSVKKGLLFHQTIFSDDTLVAIPYLYSADTAHGPAIRCNANSGLYKAFRYEFDTLWKLNAD